ncbi:baseplate assembly protein [Chitinimonas sp. PSY-7]|uniref:baseplate J/gp47 family protein n=1 Tax=Chitinimonas sp. PSY-7 TaxID=3459088 RepID=UPI0040403A90
MIDLSLLPAPDIVEPLDYEALFEQRKARLLTLIRAEERPAVAKALALESEPMVKLLQESAYRELTLRARINDAARASLLAHATGCDLDNRVADYGVSRLLISPEDTSITPLKPAIWESDHDLRNRARMALEGFSVAGSRGAYLFHCLSASEQVADASIDAPTFAAAPLNDNLRSQLPSGCLALVCTYDAGLDNPLPGDVSIAILPRTDAHVEVKALLDNVQAALSAEDVRPLTDNPRVLFGKAQPFEVVARLEIATGPDTGTVQTAARQRLESLLTSTRKLGGMVSRSAILAALHVTGVRNVVLASPAETIRCDVRHFPDCTAIKLEAGL